MKYNLLFSITALFFTLNLIGQKATIDLTFTAVNNGVYVKLDSIKVMNRSQGGFNVIHWPDTNLTINFTQGDLLLNIGYSTGYPFLVQELHLHKEQFYLFQNWPNPVKDQTEISLFLPRPGKVNLTVTDLMGRLLFADNENLNKGYHNFRFLPGEEKVYFLIASWNGISQCIKILATESNLGPQCILTYTGIRKIEPTLKVSGFKNGLEELESGILDAPVASKRYIFQFATNLPCPGTPEVTYMGQVYSTIQIFSQCWMKGNINVGEQVNGSFSQNDNGMIEKYCYNNNSDSCTKFGGLYQWAEMMQFTTQEGSQGICPLGWHVPTDEEWKVLEGAVDSQYGIGDSVWDLDGWEQRGYDAGTNLKTNNGWNSASNGSDLFGFSGLPSGLRNPFTGYLFVNNGTVGGWWTSTERDDRAIARSLVKDPWISRGIDPWSAGRSVRCLRNY